MIEVCCSTGIDCWPWRGLEVGRHVVGRSSAAQIWIDDPDLELFHAVIEVGSTEEAASAAGAGDAGIGGTETERAGRNAATVRVTQLAGRVPMMAKQQPIEGDVVVDLPGSLTFGAVEIQFRRGAQAVSPAGSTLGAAGAARSVRLEGRSGRQGHLAGRGTSAGTAVGIVAPEVGAVCRLPPITALFGALVGVVLAAITMLASAPALLTLVALVGAAVCAANWIAQAVIVGRSNRSQRCIDEVDRRRFVAELRALQATVKAEYCADHADLVDRLDVESPPRCCASARAEAPLEHCAGDGAIDVVIGRGSVAWADSIGWAGLCGSPVGRAAGRHGVRPADVDNEVVRFAVIDDVPISVLARPGDSWAVVGDLLRCDSLVRSMVCQLGMLDRSMRWKLVVLTNEVGRWAWSAELPNCWDDAGVPMIVEPTDPARVTAVFADLFAGERGSIASRRTRVVVVVDRAAQSAYEEVRGELPASVVGRLVSLLLSDADTSAPSCCQQSIIVGSGGRIELAGAAEAEAGPEFERHAELRDVQMCGISSRGVAELADRLRRP